MTSILFGPLFYINGMPHVGHKLTVYIINMIHRLYISFGKLSIRYSGTDEHGDKIRHTLSNIQLQNKNLTYDDFIQKMRLKFSEILTGFNIYNTHTDYHFSYLKSIYKKLKSMGIIYEGVYEGFYSIIEERYIGSDEINNYDIHDTNKIIKRMETGLFMRISEEISNDIIKHIDDIIYSKHYLSEAINLLKTTKDIFISRKVRDETLIPIDEYKDLSFYVWFDAINYYNVILNSHCMHTIKSVIFIGCDIMRFHIVMLLHISYYLYNGFIPYRFVIHGMISSNNIKISKSLDNFQLANEMHNKYGQFFFPALLSAGLDGEIKLSTETFDNYITYVKNNIKNFYSRLIGLNEKYKDMNTDLQFLSLEFGNKHIMFLQMQMNELMKVMYNFKVNKIYEIMSNIACRANLILTESKIWDVDNNKIIYWLISKVYMRYLIIMEFIIGHDMSDLMKKIDPDLNYSIDFMYITKLNLNKLTSSDVII